MGNDTKYLYAGYWIRRFLCEYLVTVKNMSANTQKSYRDTFRLLLSQASAKLQKSVDTLLIDDLSSQLIKEFLQYLEDDRGCSVRTRNQRLAAVYALAKYVAMQSPEHVEWCRKVRTVPIKKASKKLISYLEKDEMQKLLDLPNRKTEQGLRDYVLLLFLYNTGARAEEASAMKVKDISVQKGRNGLSVVSITGKGRKTRRCPLWKKTSEAIATVMHGKNADDPVFCNRRGEQITRFGVYEMVRRYAEILEKQFPELKQKRISPHTIRHTCATHLLQSGVDINTIRAWLGHVSVNTTNIDAEVNMEMKVKALLGCETDVGKEKTVKWKNDKDLMAFLDSI